MTNSTTMMIKLSLYADAFFIILPFTFYSFQFCFRSDVGNKGTFF